MCDLLQNEWRRRVTTAPFRSTATFTDAGLTLGLDTILVPIAKTVAPVMSLSNGRLAALLTVAGHGRAFSLSALQIDQALVDWQIGEKALAAIRLAFLPLPRLSDETDAYRLFLAEKALDAGVTPAELLAHLGYAEALRSLRKYPGQPRDPKGISTGGQYAGGQTGTAAHVTPVFLDTRRQQELEAKELPPWLSHEPYSSSIPDGHALDMGVPGGSPMPMPFLAPRVEPSERDGEGPNCPPEAPDRSNGPNSAADAWEHFVHGLVNSTNPTKDGNAYYLPNPLYVPGPGAKNDVSFDDCKKTDEPSAIPGLRKGDMVDAKNYEFNKLFDRNWSTALDEIGKQIRKQNKAVEMEGFGRNILYCFDGEFAASKVREKYGRSYPRSRFLDCRPFRGS